MKKSIVIYLSLALIACPGPAYAADDSTGPYVNIGVTQLSADLDLSDVDIQGTSVNFGEQSADVTMVTGRIGYRVMDFLAIEAEGGIGLNGDSFQQTVPVDAGTFGIVNVDTDVDVDVDSYAAVFARGIIPIEDKFELFGRIGYGTAKATASATGSVVGLSGFTASASESASTDDFAYGVGAQYNINDRTGIRLDYSSIGGDANVISLSAALRF